MTTQIYESKAKERREELKTISQPLKELVKDGKYETLNAAIIEELYKKEGNETFRTFEQWKKDGYSIVKGSRSFAVWGRPREIEQKEGEEDESKRDFYPICYLFSNKQVYKRDTKSEDSAVSEPKALYKAFAEARLSYKPERSINMLSTVLSSRDASESLKPLFAEFIEHHEAFAILLLNQANKILGFAEISRGGVSGTVADPRIIFQYAILGNASGIILAHNHPSGNLKPSEADIKLTKKIKEGAKFFDISVLDHIILTETSYYSFADEGAL